MEISSLLAGVKKAFELAQQSDNYELVKEMMSIQSMANSLQDENRSLKEEIDKLKSLNKIADEIYLKGDAYYLKKDNGVEDGPYCTRCWDKDKLLIRCRVWEEAYTNKLVCDCPECNSQGYLKNSDER